MLGSILSQYLPGLLALLAVVLALLLHPREEMMMSCPAPSTTLQTPPDAGVQLKVETLNTWGLWLVSKKRRQRMLCLAQHLKQSDADVVILQEVWVRADVELLREQAAIGTLQHAVHFQGGAIGSGLMVLSRHPIVQVGFHPYSARGDPFRVLNGDYFAGKGVGWAAVRTPAGVVDVFNTHLSANYHHRWSGGGSQGLGCRVPGDAYAGVRLLQMIELAGFVKGRSSPGAVGTIVAGDLNAAPDTLEIALFQALLPQLHDSWRTVHPQDSGFTGNAPQNSFRKTSSKGAHQPSRIDYIWSGMRPTAAALILSDTGLGLSYSDHIGLTAALSFVHGGSSDATQPAAAAAAAGGALEKTHASSRASLRRRQQPQQEEEQQQLGMPSSSAGAVHKAYAAQGTLDGGLAKVVLSVIERAREKMEAGRTAMILAAVALWMLALSCLAALLAYPWCHYPASVHIILLLCMGAAFGWAGALLLGGFVGRGIEAAALRQAALQLQVQLRSSG